MKNLQILALLILLATGVMHGAVSKEEHWIGYNNPYDDQFDGEIEFHGDSFQQAINQRDRSGDTFLLQAVYENNVPEQKIKNLIELGADVNQQDEFGRKPLNVAIWYNLDKMIQLLIAGGADINQQDKFGFGYTPLHHAAIRNADKAMIALLYAGADINQCNIFDDTALHFAAKHTSREVIQLLLIAGADSTIKNNRRRTARDCIRDKTTLTIFDEALRLSNK